MHSRWKRELRRIGYLYACLTVEIILASLVYVAVFVLTLSEEIALLSGMSASVILIVCGFLLLARHNLL